MTPYRPRIIGSRRSSYGASLDAIHPGMIGKFSTHRSEGMNDLIWWLQFEICQEPGLNRLTDRIIDSLDPSEALSLYRQSGDFLGAACDWAFSGLAAIKRDTRDDPRSVMPERQWIRKRIRVEILNFIQRGLSGSEMDGNSSWVVPILSRHRVHSIARAEAAIAKTRVANAIWDVLDKTQFVGGISLVLGALSTGRGFAIAQWARRCAGRARWFSTPPGHDVHSLVRAFATCLGDPGANTDSNKMVESRVRDLIASESLVFVLDSAERLWPGTPRGKSGVARIEWLVSVFTAESRSSLVLVGTEIDEKKGAHDRNLWSQRSGADGTAASEATARLNSSLAQVVRLPPMLSLAEFRQIAEVSFPSASGDDWDAIAEVVNQSENGLSAFGLISRTATASASASGRSEPNAEDFAAGLTAVFDVKGALKRIGEAGPTNRHAPNKPQNAVGFPVSTNDATPHCRNLPTTVPQRTGSQTNASERDLGRGDLTERIPDVAARMGDFHASKAV